MHFLVDYVDKISKNKICFGESITKQILSTKIYHNIILKNHKSYLSNKAKDSPGTVVATFSYSIDDDEITVNSLFSNPPYNYVIYMSMWYLDVRVRIQLDDVKNIEFNLDPSYIEDIVKKSMSRAIQQLNSTYRSVIAGLIQIHYWIRRSGQFDHPNDKSAALMYQGIIQRHDVDIY